MKYFILVVLVSIFGWPLIGQQQAFNLYNGTFAKGYDVVAYHTLHKAIKGNKNIYLEHDGGKLLFVSENNKTLFLKNPSSYMPQYGGWCAYAIGKNGEKVDIDPETFKIIHGKLYLFYNAYFNNTLKKWNKNEAFLKKAADQNWNKIIQK